MLAEPIEHLLKQPEGKQLEFKRIFADAAAQGLPEPRIEEIANRLRFTVPLSQQHTLQLDSVTQSVTQSELQPENLMAMLIALRNSPLASGELLARLGLKHRTNFRNNYLIPALQAGLIEQTLPETPNSRLQKYRLSSAGQHLIKDTP